jgi:hypothetical protein
MKKLINISVLSLGLLVGSTALAQQTTTPSQTPQSNPTDSTPVPVPFEEKVAQAKLLLSGYHGLPDAKTFTKQLGDPKMVLMAIALDEDGFDLYRKRALSALGLFADADVLRTYIDLLQDEDTPEGTQHRLLVLLADHFPDSALPYLQPYVDHDDLRYRLTAIEAIRRIPSNEALAVLHDAKTSERNKTALRRLDQYTQSVE